MKLERSIRCCFQEKALSCHCGTQQLCFCCCDNCKCTCWMEPPDLSRVPWGPTLDMEHSGKYTFLVLSPWNLRVVWSCSITWFILDDSNVISSLCLAFHSSTTSTLTSVPNIWMTLLWKATVLPYAAVLSGFMLLGTLAAFNTGSHLFLKIPSPHGFCDTTLSTHLLGYWLCVFSIKPK